MMGYWEKQFRALELDFQTQGTESRKVVVARDELQKVANDEHDRYIKEGWEAANAITDLKTTLNQRNAQILRMQAERPYALSDCMKPHVSVNDLEAVAALRKENDQLREDTERLKRDLQSSGTERRALLDTVTTVRQHNDEMRGRLLRAQTAIPSTEQQHLDAQQIHRLSATNDRLSIALGLEKAEKERLGHLASSRGESLAERDRMLSEIEQRIASLALG